MPDKLYFLECSYGRHGNAFPELDRDSNSRVAVIGLISSGEVNPIKVLEVDEDAGTVRDVTAEILSEATAHLSLEPLVSALEAKWDHDRDLRKHERA
jgi:hypothetical protein